MKTVAFRFEGRHRTHLIYSSPRMEEMTRERAIPIVIEGEVGRLENVGEGNCLICAGNHDGIQNFVLREVNPLGFSPLKNPEFRQNAVLLKDLLGKRKEKKKQ
jgi:hypothetical protein